MTSISATGLLKVGPPEQVSMRTSDGTRLDADIYRPQTGGPYPVLLQRQAYGRSIACTICYAHPSWYAAHGYIVVVQDIRGRGTSEGKFVLGANDISDGAEAVEWAAKLPGSTGEVGMYGFSYQAYNQLMAALGDSPSLKALAPAMFAWKLREDWAYENGAFRLGGALAWAIQIAAETARHAGDRAAYVELLGASRSVPYLEDVFCRPAIIEKHRDLSHYHRWLDTRPDDPYWTKASAGAHSAALKKRKLPILAIGGWFDSLLKGTLAGISELADADAGPLLSVIGPWTHFPWDRKVGPLDFGPEAARNMDELHVRWFDQWLKGKDNGFSQTQSHELYDMGARQWRKFSKWPDAKTGFFLEGGGRASIDLGDGSLAANAPAHDARYECLVQDPWRPAPAVGGSFGGPPGPTDRSGVDARGDVLTFTTAPFERPFTIVGDVQARLYAESDGPSFDLCCTLSRVTANGQSFVLCEGFRKVDHVDGLVEIPMRATCITLVPGESLRLSIAGAAFPAIPVNPGTGDDPTRTPSVKARITTTRILHGSKHPSQLILTQPDPPAQTPGAQSYFAK